MAKMAKVEDLWQCQDCLGTTKYKTRLWEHIESRHVEKAFLKKSENITVQLILIQILMLSSLYTRIVV